MARRGYGPRASLMPVPGAGGAVAARDGFARPSPLSAWAERHVGWLLAAPAVLLILALTAYPLAYSLWVSFVNYDFLVPGHAFVGLQQLHPGRRRSLSHARRCSRRSCSRSWTWLSSSRSASASRCSLELRSPGGAS